jgi:uncharacterized protein YbbK (DUF523 family)
LDQLEVSADNLDIGKAAGIYNAFVKWVPICPEVEIGMGHRAKRSGSRAVSMTLL